VSLNCPGPVPGLSRALVPTLSNRNHYIVPGVLTSFKDNYVIYEYAHMPREFSRKARDSPGQEIFMPKKYFNGPASSFTYTVTYEGGGAHRKTHIRSEDGSSVYITGEWELAEWAGVLAHLVAEFQEGVNKGTQWIEVVDGP